MFIGFPASCPVSMSYCQTVCRICATAQHICLPSGFNTTEDIYRRHQYQSPSMPLSNVRRRYSHRSAHASPSQGASARRSSLPLAMFGSQKPIILLHMDIYNFTSSLSAFAPFILCNGSSPDCAWCQLRRQGPPRLNCRRRPLKVNSLSAGRA